MWHSGIPVSESSQLQQCSCTVLRFSLCEVWEDNRAFMLVSVCNKRDPLSNTHPGNNREHNLCPAVRKCENNPFVVFLSSKIWSASSEWKLYDHRLCGWKQKCYADVAGMRSNYL